MTILHNRKPGARKILLFVCGALYIDFTHASEVSSSCNSCNAIQPGRLGSDVEVTIRYARLALTSLFVRAWTGDAAQKGASLIDYRLSVIQNNRSLVALNDNNR